MQTVTNDSGWKPAAKTHLGTENTTGFARFVETQYPDSMSVDIHYDIDKGAFEAAAPGKILFVTDFVYARPCDLTMEQLEVLVVLVKEADTYERYFDILTSHCFTKLV
ncbi:hypothetical protein UFOVP1492_12 [uncultured Caudovirales phage]|uniref:Uncharacterized protein n=1 Tax=uncultured Caudovirales phage TaxID=2100421 RepID=A0A6J7XJ72_9CAUD|nr:hypothetical protein UFOVP1127_122 [uncultured Caudovirales phage]CAB4193482.1 hypothetical protein UFOVP1242_88 [uncultured Caudovirales phage]CAB4217147.1 hypothetical protein UFOVP1492_12 [uncultured Caudovirales phage]CAB5231235.1 hypothetical protein UFOVP1580_41 [uncultured Caudovirales phage]